jgi:ferrous iron transport protein B
MSKSHKIDPQNRILLMGNPNVGKSVFFTQLTGIHAISSNYVGTTVTYMEGHLPVGNNEYTLADVPGTYSLTPTSEAESVAAKFIESGAKAVICVLDASNLERNLRLALEIRRYNIPMVYTLNLLDVAERHGITINAKLLEQELNAPVIPTVAVKRVGLNELRKHLECILEDGDRPFMACGNCASCPSCYKTADNARELKPGDIPAAAKQIAARVMIKDAAQLSFIDKFGEKMMKPFPGVPIAAAVLAALIAFVAGVGRILEEEVFGRLVGYVIVPFFRSVFSSLPDGAFRNILIGEFGIFVISFEWILAVILPYVFLFYAAFSFLEDSGYLPRIGVLFDNIMRKLGVQGGSLIYTLMGFGCAVPAIIGSRAATTRKERLVITAAICFAIPCISQTGALLSLLSSYDRWLTPAIIVFGLILFVTVALIAGKVVRGKSDPLLIEIPNLLIPEPRAYGRKLMTRMKHFLKAAEVPMLAAIVFAAVLSESGLLNVIARYAEPLVSRWLGMPSEAVVALILGIVRREMSVAPLLALELTNLQAFVGGIVSLMYLPCLSVFAILVKEFRLKIAIGISAGTVVVALFIGGVVNQIARLILQL